MYDASEYTQAPLHLHASSAGSLGLYGSYICTDIKKEEEVTSPKWADVIVNNCRENMVICDLNRVIFLGLLGQLERYCNLHNNYKTVYFELALLLSII